MRDNRLPNDLDFTDSNREFKPHKLNTPDWRSIVARGAVLVVSLVLVFWVIYKPWKALYCWGGDNYATCHSIDAVEPWLILVGMLVGLGVMVYTTVIHTTADIGIKRAYAKRAGTTYTRFGDPLPLDAYDKVDPTTVLGLIAQQYGLSTQLEAKIAPYKQLQSVNNYSPSVNLSNQGKGDTAQTQAALEDGGGLVSPDAWLPWLTDVMYPHLLLIGKTRSGKSTLADIVLKYRAERGDKIAILDPHWSTQDKHGNRKWGGIEPMAVDTTGLAGALKLLKSEYDDRKRRMQLPADDPRFIPEGCFEPLTILIDEVPEVVAELAVSKLTDKIWGETVKIFGSGGAKVNINVILLSQSPNVEDVGINGKMRENFTAIALGNMARQFIIQSVRDREAQERLLSLLSGGSKAGMSPAQTPAAAEYGGEVQVLSRDGVLQYRSPVIDAEVWAIGRDTELAAPVRSSGDDENLLNSLFSGFDGTEGRTDGMGREEKIGILKGYYADGLNREEARQRLAEEHREGFTNALWTAVTGG